MLKQVGSSNRRSRIGSVNLRQRTPWWDDQRLVVGLVLADGGTRLNTTKVNNFLCMWLPRLAKQVKHVGHVPMLAGIVSRAEKSGIGVS